MHIEVLRNTVILVEVRCIWEVTQNANAFKKGWTNF